MHKEDSRSVKILWNMLYSMAQENANTIHISIFAIVKRQSQIIFHNSETKTN